MAVILINGDSAVVEAAYEEASAVAKALLAAASDPLQVETVSVVRGVGFRVPVAVAEAADLGFADLAIPATQAEVESRDSLTGQIEKVQEESEDLGITIGTPFDSLTTPPPVPAKEPRGNASRAEWAAFLTQHGVAFPEDPEAEGGNQTALRELWKAHQAQSAATI